MGSQRVGHNCTLSFDRHCQHAAHGNSTNLHSLSYFNIAPEALKASNDFMSFKCYSKLTIDALCPQELTLKRENSLSIYIYIYILIDCLPFYNLPTVLCLGLKKSGRVSVMKQTETASKVVNT